MDNVLIPYQNGQPINTDLVTLYLSGLLVAAILAWILGWGVLTCWHWFQNVLA